MGIGIEGVRIKRVGSGRCLLMVFSLFDFVCIGRQGVIFWIQCCDHVFGCSVSVDRRYFGLEFTRVEWTWFHRRFDSYLTPCTHGIALGPHFLIDGWGC
jgi:hypothetical protein